MIDRELIEAAAKAAGVNGDYEDSTWGDPPVRSYGICQLGSLMLWNPLTSDADAFRLAVKIGMDIFRADLDVEAVAALPPYASMERNVPAPCGIEKVGDDPYAATRRAIVKAAAEIGKSMP